MDLSLTVRKVWSGRKGGAVFTGQDEEGTLHRVVAEASVLHCPPGVGEQWRVKGSHRVHPKFGPQIHAECAAPTPPKGELLRRFLARNRAFQGVGEARARKLWDAFGESLYDLLNSGNAGRLAEVLDPGLAASLVDTWQESQAEAKVIHWLENHGFSAALGNKVMRLWGAEAPGKISENPYRMLAVADWSRVDAAALDAGASPDCPERRTAAVEATCYRAMERKHTALPELELLDGIRRLLRCPPEGARMALALAEGDRAVVRIAEGLWQPYGPWVMETFVLARIQERVETGSEPSRTLFWSPPDRVRIHEMTNSFEALEGLRLTDEQRHAVWLAMTHRLGMVLGGAGTGKTSMLKALRYVQET